MDAKSTTKAEALLKDMDTKDARQRRDWMRKADPKDIDALFDAEDERWSKAN